MKKVLIASFDMEVGGVERSLIGMLNHFDYDRYKVDLMLYSHTGDFMNLIPEGPNLLKEKKAYKTFRMSIGETIKSGNLPVGMTRLYSKYKANKNHSPENGYKQMQYMWKYSLPLLPRLNREYDVAISYLWPHYFVAEKVKARTKIAWIHTDYSTVDTDVKLDLDNWKKYDHIVAVSEQCRTAFLKKYPTLEQKVMVLENITSPEVIKGLAEEKVENPMQQDSRFKIVTVARFSHAKGIDQAVLAMKKLKERGYTDIAWYVVGYGGDEKSIRELIRIHKLEDQFHLLGKKINPYPFIKEADLYVQPSRYEGKAVTVCEAQILSKPVLITNYPTASSQVRDGIDGSICGLTSDGIAEGIENLYRNQILRKSLAYHCERIDFNNNQELQKLYKLV